MCTAVVRGESGGVAQRWGCAAAGGIAGGKAGIKGQDGGREGWHKRADARTRVHEGRTFQCLQEVGLPIVHEMP